MKKIILTGGGTGGHVIPALALCVTLQKEGYEIHYIGSYKGIERELVHRKDLPYYSISAGKLRRYINKENVTDMFRTLKGVKEAKKHIKKIKPNIVFSKGGFVSVPVVIAAKLSGVPVIVHESDLSMGLANKISTKFAKKICVTFEETLKTVGNKAVYTGTPIRQEILSGDAKKGRTLAGFDNNLPVVLVMGGSSGAVRVNNAIRNALPKLVESFNVIHLCGKGNVDNSISPARYKQLEFASVELPHLYALCDVIISRAGSNALQEFLALKKPSLLVPLPLTASRGDQIQNANIFAKAGYATILEDENLNTENIISKLTELYKNKDKYVSNIENAQLPNAIDTIVQVIKEHTS
jgi:UDP-N-acetylglucosamine--N-acetylmuramyl-(pentapeptide) pyrophosphoryl-undecaprenol N-acetylglucosamine transferase